MKRFLARPLFMALTAPPPPQCLRVGFRMLQLSENWVTIELQLRVNSKYYHDATHLLDSHFVFTGPSSFLFSSFSTFVLHLKRTKIKKLKKPTKMVPRTRRTIRPSQSKPTPPKKAKTKNVKAKMTTRSSSQNY
jgi:hypothetical protein